MKAPLSKRQMPEWYRKALTLVELLLAVVLIGTLLSIGIPIYKSQLDKARNTKAISDIHVIQVEIIEYMIDNEMLPESLEELGKGREKLRDPWGTPYQYLKIEGKRRRDVQGKWRKDRFLVPLNSDFDLYSKGKDKKSRPPLTARVSRDDIVRANNGGYLGLASKY